ncbi:MAG: 3'(2'),5'-bisphosphate nucleotidase CysQ [bacterium]
MNNPETVASEIIRLVHTAGERVRFYYNKDYKIEIKDDNSPLTKADTESNDILVAGLKKYGYPVLAEESIDDKKRLDSEFIWTVDPLDGTKDFIQKTGEFSIIVGLIKNGEPIMGIVYQPVTGETYYGIKGQGSYKIKDGQKVGLKTSTVSETAEARAIVSRNHSGGPEEDLAKKLQVKNYVKCGSVSLKMCKIAENKADIYLSLSPKSWEWDSAGGVVVLQEAGGVVTGMQGQDLKFNKKDPHNLDGIVGSANKELNKKITKEIK